MSYATTNAGQRLDIVKTGLVAAAAVGWGLFAYSTLSSGSQEQAVQTEILQLHQQIEDVTAERDQLAQERDRRIQASQDLQNVQKQIEAAIQELQQLDACEQASVKPSSKGAFNSPDRQVRRWRKRKAPQSL
jgi:uncharacterized protein YlxW (UPF0749 family)